MARKGKDLCDQQAELKGKNGSIKTVAEVI